MSKSPGPSFPELTSLSRSPSPSVVSHAPYSNAAGPNTNISSSTITVESIMDEFMSSFDKATSTIHSLVDLRANSPAEMKARVRDVLDDLRKEAIHARSAFIHKFSSYRTLVTKLEESLSEANSRLSKFSVKAAQDANDRTSKKPHHQPSMSGFGSDGGFNGDGRSLSRMSSNVGDVVDGPTPGSTPPNAARRKGRVSFPTVATAVVSVAGRGNRGNASSPVALPCDSRSLTQQGLEILTLGIADIADAIGGQVNCCKVLPNGSVDRDQVQNLVAVQKQDQMRRRETGHLFNQHQEQERSRSVSPSLLNREKQPLTGGTTMLVGDDRVWAEIHRSTKGIDRIIVALDSPVILRLNYVCWLDIEKPKLTVVTDILEQDLRSFIIAITHLAGKVLGWREKGAMSLTPEPDGRKADGDTTHGTQEAGASPGQRMPRKDVLLSAAVAPPVFRSYKLERFGYRDDGAAHLVDVHNGLTRARNVVMRFSNALLTFEEPQRLQEKVLAMEEVWKQAVNKISVADTQAREVERERNRLSDKCRSYEVLLQNKEQEIQSLRSKMTRLEIECDTAMNRLREHNTNLDHGDALDAMIRSFSGDTASYAGTHSSPSHPIALSNSSSLVLGGASPPANKSPQCEKHGLFSKFFYTGALPVFIMTTTWQVVFANHRFCSLSGYAESELQIDGLRMLGLRKTFQALFLREASEYSAVFSMLTKKSATLNAWFAIASLPNRKNRPLFYVACIPLEAVDAIPRDRRYEQRS